MGTYACIFRDSGGYTIHPVKNREVKALPLDEETSGFLFLDEDDEGKESNISTYRIVDRIMSSEDLKQDIKNPDILAWELRVMETHATTHLVRTRGYALCPPEKNIIYVNREKEVIWPLEETSAAKEAAQQEICEEQEKRIARLHKMAPKPMFGKGK